MPRQIIDTTTPRGDFIGDPAKTAFDKANANFAEVYADTAAAYKKSNILGPVSISSGVPTGAIIERGANANGEFSRFADGTLIAVLSYTGSDPAGSVRNITTPAAFVGGFTAAGIGIAFIPSNSWQQGRFLPKAYMTNTTTLSVFFDSALENNRLTFTITGRWY